MCDCLVCPLVGKTFDETLELCWNLESGDLRYVRWISRQPDPVIRESLSKLAYEYRNEYNISEVGKEVELRRGTVHFELLLYDKQYKQNYGRTNRRRTKNSVEAYEYFTFKVRPYEDLKN